MKLPLLLLVISSPIAFAHGGKHKHIKADAAAPVPSLAFPISSLTVPIPHLPSTPPPPKKHTPDISLFSRRLYASVGGGNETILADFFKKEYQTLEADFEAAKPTLGATLNALFEMRLQDLQASVQRVKKMQGVLDLLNP